MNHTYLTSWLVLWTVCGSTAIQAEEFFVGGDSAHVSINAALSVAEDGDLVIVRPGRYEETIETRAPGVTIRAAEGGEVLVTTPGYVLRVRHERITVEGLTLDGQFSDRDGVQVRGESHGLTLRNVEVRNVGSDCVDMGSQRDVTIEGCLIHHCLLAEGPNCDEPNCRGDAHGIAGAAMRNLTVRDTEIHTFSGDALQLDAGRNEPGWSGLVIEGCRIWLGPLTQAVGGFAAGIIPGENALDTKTSNTVMEPAEVTVRNTHVWGFRGGLIGNMSAFNLKENVRVHLHRVTVSDSEIAFRLRGRTGSRPRGAQVTISNAVVYNVDKVVRYEDDIDVVRMYNTTLGGDIGRLFQDASQSGRIEGRNVLVQRDALPEQLLGGRNLAVNAACFVDPRQGNYQLMPDCAAIDTGEMLADVTVDRLGISRPQGVGWDIGAYEFCDDSCRGAEPDAGNSDGGFNGPDRGGLDAGASAADASRPSVDGTSPLDVGAQLMDGSDLHAQDVSTVADALVEPAKKSGSGGCSQGADRSGVTLLVLLLFTGLRRRGTPRKGW